jgi:hypothetical protein
VEQVQVPIAPVPVVSASPVEVVPVVVQPTVEKPIQNIEVKAPIEAVKTEIEAVEKNKNVPVNPMSQNIQFGETKSV